MKIAFIGTHGVGKTTLCFELAACLKRLDVSVDVVKEVARHCPLPINRDTTLDAQQWILHSQIAQEIELSQAYEAIVCDRAVLDNYAYLVHATGRQEGLEGLIRHWMSTYSMLVKVPVISPPAFDGTRDVSVDFQLEIDGLITELTNDFGLETVDLDPSDRDNWIRVVLRKAGLPETTPQLDLFNNINSDTL
jgi:predicted ATPase